MNGDGINEIREHSLSKSYFKTLFIIPDLNLRASHKVAIHGMHTKLGRQAMETEFN